MSAADPRDAARGNLDREDPSGARIRHVHRRDAARGAVALALLFILLLPVVADAVRGYGYGWPYPAPIAANGRFMKVLEAQDRNRMINVSLGLAARWAAQGVPRGLLVPRDLEDLADLPPDLFEDTPIQAMKAYLIKLFIHGRIRSGYYDPEVSTDVFDAYLASGTVKQFPFHIYALRRKRLPGSRLVAIKDSGSDRIAIIPAVIARINTCASPLTDPVCPEPEATHPTDDQD